MAITLATFTLRVGAVYDIAITVSACLQAGTRADVAWLVASDGIPVNDWSDAVVFTPGGGKIGSLLGGAVDGTLGEFAGRLAGGRLIDVEVSQVDALIAELPGTGSVQVLMAPAESLPRELWRMAADRHRFVLQLELRGGAIEEAKVFDASTIASAPESVRHAFENSPSGATQLDDGIVSIFDAISQLVIVGGGPIADALASLAPLLGWQAKVTADRDTATGLIAPLSGIDKVVIAAHDLELAGAGLQAALGSQCGYIGSVGSRKMQEDRADWLAYRGLTDLSRIHGPAGLDIGAGSPSEVAVAIAAEVIATSRD